MTGGRAASHDECTQYVEVGVAYRSHSTPAALAGCVCVSGRRRGGAARGGGVKGTSVALLYPCVAFPFPPATCFTIHDFARLCVHVILLKVSQVSARKGCPVCLFVCFTSQMLRATCVVGNPCVGVPRDCLVTAALPTSSWHRILAPGEPITVHHSLPSCTSLAHR